ncbi:hypothetical protein BCR37DRAFT_384182 [Protomyces lactucae-debilis]|uniref:Uncharacterized protein n=1 Tax=Protomyces lactucae-debilis TaxID=2754530 RepID=A0A1Y2EUA6_PROLT|nr:uncharacterized protein BCR37DRAFT_384182 [Protomyces lactucae-debilis]ORY75119.1 hypothetical protein BCR37DRAFT_384182 [Protomyces lactucae-debilis]
MEDDTEEDIMPLLNSDEEPTKPKKPKRAKKATAPKKKIKKQLAAEAKQAEVADPALADEDELASSTPKSIAKDEPKDEPIEVKLASDEEEKPAVVTHTKTKKTKKAPAKPRKQATKKRSLDSAAASGKQAAVGTRRAPKRGAQKQAVQETASDDGEH